MSDSVKNPTHYTSHPSGVECIDITKHMNFCCGNVVKYVWRHGLKDAELSGKALEDLKKARQYLDFEIQRMEEAQKTAKPINDFHKRILENPFTGGNID